MKENQKQINEKEAFIIDFNAAIKNNFLKYIGTTFLCNILKNKSITPTNLFMVKTMKLIK